MVASSSVPVNAAHEPLAKVLTELGRRKHGAVFLDRLLFWWPKAVVFHNGRYWIYRENLGEWAEEVGCSLDTVRWLVRHFKADGLVVTERFKRRNKKGRPYGTTILHISVEDHLIRTILDRCKVVIDNPKGQDSPDQSGTGVPGASDNDNGAAMTSVPVAAGSDNGTSVTGVPDTVSKVVTHGETQGATQVGTSVHAHVHEEDQLTHNAPSPLSKDSGEDLPETDEETTGAKAPGDDECLKEAPGAGAGQAGAINVTWVDGEPCFPDVHDAKFMHPSTKWEKEWEQKTIQQRHNVMQLYLENVYRRYENRGTSKKMVDDVIRTSNPKKKATTIGWNTPDDKVSKVARQHWQKPFEVSISRMEAVMNGDLEFSNLTTTEKKAYDQYKAMREKAA